LHEAYINLASLLADQNKFHDAAELLKKRLENCDTASDLHYNLANLLRDLGDHDEAIQHYTRAVHLSPDFVDARENLVRALLANDRSQDALLVLQEWLKVFPESSMARHMLASLDGENVPDLVANALVSLSDAQKSCSF
jgi:tetratricopeptide (TPR) repeat protein